MEITLSNAAPATLKTGVLLVGVLSAAAMTPVIASPVLTAELREQLDRGRVF